MNPIGGVGPVVTSGDQVTHQATSHRPFHCRIYGCRRAKGARGAMLGVYPAGWAIRQLGAGERLTGADCSIACPSCGTVWVVGPSNDEMAA